MPVCTATMPPRTGDWTLRPVEPGLITASAPRIMLPTVRRRHSLKAVCWRHEPLGRDQSRRRPEVKGTNASRRSPAVAPIMSSIPLASLQWCFHFGVVAVRNVRTKRSTTALPRSKPVLPEPSSYEPPSTAPACSETRAVGGGATTLEALDTGESKPCALHPAQNWAIVARDRPRTVCKADRAAGCWPPGAPSWKPVGSVTVA